MHERDAVDSMTADNAQMCHVHALLTVFFHARHASHTIEIARPFPAHFLQYICQIAPTTKSTTTHVHKLLIYRIDDLQMTRQQIRQQTDRPTFERLGEQRMICVARIE
jgi:hypothetical protein